MNSNAVYVSRVTKSYGRGRDRVVVLNKINVTVPSGSIYGLLGPSGCGKTTLLRCIMGRLKIDGGSLITLQKSPGTVGHHIPGKLVGYMPQELALYNEFTVEETLNYFGRLNGMTSVLIKSRISFLIQFLNLPEKERIIGQLSGGQQRRASFAIALLHEPEILILDEPTVGVDPILRLRIWNHLLSISSESHTTVIITTHYIEEARQAHVVGLMRNGRLLAETTPDQLLLKYEKSSLEDVFLLLCEADKGADNDDDDDEGDDYDRSSGDNARSSIVDSCNHQPSVIVRTAGGGDRVDETTPLLSNGQNLQNAFDASNSHYQHSTSLTTWQKLCWYLPSFRNVIALFIKNLLLLKRQIGVLLFEFFLPVIQITLFCLCIGGDPRHLMMGIVNNETCSNSSGTLCASDLFLQNLDPKLVVQENFNHRFDDAYSAARMGKTWGIIEIGENFTLCLIDRYIEGKHDNETIEGSTVHLYLDMTNEQISMALEQEVLRAFEGFSTQVLQMLGLNPNLAQVPVKLEGAIYGNLKPSFTDFMAPGIIITIPFFLATGLTAMSFVLERKQGLLDRSLVSGVGAVEIMIGHIATQFLVMLVQVGLLLAIALAAFKIPFEGSLVLVIILTLLQGLTGMALGFLISALCDEETSAIQFALGSVYPNLLLSGIIWPLEAMPTWLQYISYCLPMTFAAESMRSILSRGWGLTYVNVWRGFVMSIGWGGLLMILSGFALAMRRF